MLTNPHQETWLTAFARYCRREVAQGTASPATQETYERIARRFLSWLGDRPFDREALLDYRSALVARQYKPATIALHLEVAHLLAQALQLAGHLPADVRLHGVRPPPERLSPLEKRVILSEEEAQRVLAVAAYHPTRDERSALRCTLIIALMLIEGARTIEVARLTEHDVFLSEQLIRFRGKRHDRLVPLTPEVAALLAAWLPQRGPGPWVFPSPRAGGAQPLTTRRIRGIVVTVLAEAGVRVKAQGRVSAHSLRHTFASLALAHGADIMSVKQAGGWRKLATVELYLHALPGTTVSAPNRVLLHVPTPSG